MLFHFILLLHFSCITPNSIKLEKELTNQINKKNLIIQELEKKVQLQSQSINDNDKIINLYQNQLDTKDRKSDIEVQLNTYHKNIPLITTTCIRLSLGLYIQSLSEDIKIAGKKCNINWSYEEISDTLSILLNICSFTVPSTLQQSFKNKNIATIYVNEWMKYEHKNSTLPVYKYFQKVLNDYKVNILGLFPIIVGLENPLYFENLVVDKNISIISARAITFTNDLVKAYCKKNPIMEAYIGEYLTLKAMNIFDN